ncbi:MAG: HAD family hydrolase [Selenomonadaceae bacterium]|nr:HAD family hydrolase [Selenomonadaceae bacterium]
MLRIIFLLLLDITVSLTVAAYLYYNRSQDAAIVTGLSIFLAGSPLCLILASPVTLALAGRKLAKFGITMNNSNALKILPEVNLVGLPYNRVLTNGEYFVTDIAPEMMSQTNLLVMAASVERYAEHIVGQTIYFTAISRALKLDKVTHFKELPGRGVEATVNGVIVRVGNPAWLESLGVSIGIRLRTRMDQLLVKGKTVSVVSTGKVARGIIAVKDESNPEAKKFLGTIMRSGLQTVLLTSQPKKMTNRIEKEFFFNNIRTNLTPDTKFREVQILRAKGNNIAIIGTDVNDIAAMEVADVSFAVKGGSLLPNVPEDIPEENSAEQSPENIEKISAQENVTGEQMTEDKTEGDKKFTPDFVLPTLNHFVTVRNTALKFVDVVKLNRRLAYLSWLLLLPLAFMSILPNPPIPFHPAMIVAGVSIFSAIILANSLRAKAN